MESPALILLIYLQCLKIFGTLAQPTANGYCSETTECTGGKPTENVNDYLLNEMENFRRNQFLQYEKIQGMFESLERRLAQFDRRLETAEQCTRIRISNETEDSVGQCEPPRDCADLRMRGRNVSGVYRVYPGGQSKRTQAYVYCDLNSTESWLVFQRRKDGSVDFQRTWNAYAQGFGDPNGEFWLGNEKLHILTSNKQYKLRIDMEDYDGETRWVEYSTFSISSSADNYRLTAFGYSGNAGDSLSEHNGQQFSTKDADNDSSNGHCAVICFSGWWFDNCYDSNLNGRYLRGNHTKSGGGIEWVKWRGSRHSMKTTEMKISPVTCIQ